MSEEIVILDFLSTCRTCLSQNNDMHPINDSIKTVQNNNFIIKDMLMSCTQLQISDDDGLPAHICIKCVCRISDAYLFKLNCEKSERTLRDNLINKPTSVSTEKERKRNDNCETFKDNVMNLISIAVNETNCLESSLNASSQAKEDLKKDINSVESNYMFQNNISNDILKANDVAIYHKKKQKRLKTNKKNIARVNKMVKIAPKQNHLSYSDQNKLIAINIPYGNISVGLTQPKVSKFNENFEIKNQCRICGIYFIYENEMQLHLNNIHGINDAVDVSKNICNICNIEFPILEKLNEHNLLQHCKNISYRCDECLNWYSEKELLKKHKCLIHTKMSNELSCDICEKKFHSIRGLTTHKTLHNIKSKENKISCKICDRTFSIMSNLTYHMKYHKPDICQYCNSGFCNMNMMKAHMKENHSGKKPYNCSYCNKNFNVRKVLLRHKRIVHGVFNDIYFCGICKNSNLGFLTHEVLNKHITKYHKISNDCDEPKKTKLKKLKTKDDLLKEPIEKLQSSTTNLQSANSLINICEINDSEKNDEEALGFNNSLCNTNLSQVINFNDVNTNNITVNDDGTINIALNNSALENIQHASNFSSADNIGFGDAIENTIKVLKQEIFIENKIEHNLPVTDMGEYTINEINRDENNLVECLKNNSDIIEPNVEINDIFLSGKIIDYDEEKQQYTLRYKDTDYIITAEGFHQTQFDYTSEDYNDSNKNSNEKIDLNEIDEAKEESFDKNFNFCCKVCNIKFVDQVSFNDHIPKHNIDAQNLDECRNLQKTAVEHSSEIKDGMIRINVDETTGMVTFEKSDVIFSEHDYIEVSKGERIDIPRYRCPKCDDLFTRQYSLNRHLAHTHNEMCLVCNTCGENFNRVSLLEEHRSKHKNMLNMGVIITSVENTLNESFDGNNELQNSMQEIESLYVYEPENQSFPCEFCNKTFQRQIYLERHRLIHIGMNQPGFMCSICNKIFLTSIDMQKHKRKHNEEYLQCNLCDRTFTTIGGLKYHLKTHTGTKNHKCPFCGKKFTANVNLNAHIKTVHSEVKPHLCNICGKRYTTIDHLKKHMVYHTGERKFQCGVCGKDFTQNSHLTQHSWIHSGIKPHACKYCDNKYTSSSALKKHIQAIHS